jgi:anti-anti-sigma factor
MTTTSAAPGPNRSTRYGTGTVDCGGAQVRAHCRHLATVVTVNGEIDAVNTDAISTYIRRLARVEGPLILDLSAVRSFTAAGISLLLKLDEDFRAAAVQWTLVASRPVMELLGEHGDAVFPIARSVHQALSALAETISKRRELLLPLIKKSA